jgi:hypothetical protein
VYKYIFVQERLFSKAEDRLFFDCNDSCWSNICAYIYVYIDIYIYDICTYENFFLLIKGQFICTYIHYRPIKTTHSFLGNNFSNMYRKHISKKIKKSNLISNLKKNIKKQLFFPMKKVQNCFGMKTPFLSTFWFSPYFDCCETRVSRPRLSRCILRSSKTEESTIFHGKRTCFEAQSEEKCVFI